MPPKKQKAVTSARTRFNQVVDTSLFNDLEAIRKKKNFDSVQALVRFICADFASKNPVR